LDSPAANAAFAKQIGLTFPLLSDMNRKMLKTYGILKGYNVQDETYEWALRANIIIDKQGIIQFVEEGDSAVDPNTALTMCTTCTKRNRRSNPPCCRALPAYHIDELTAILACRLPRNSNRICLKHSTAVMMAVKTSCSAT